jgi:dihydroneopterin aldolase
MNCRRWADTARVPEVGKVYLQDLEIEAVIGIHPWERDVRQRLVLQLEVAVDVAAVAARDDISLTVDYHALAGRIGEFVRTGQYRLLETLAEETAAMIMAEFGVRWLRLRVGKPGAVAGAGDVGVEIERGTP